MTPASTIGHYRITSKLGEGGMGAVYRATDTKLNREVAIKVLPPAFAEDALRMQRFEREAQALASLNHPNIAAVYGVEAGAIVMELVEGEELAGPLPVETALAYARQIAAGLESAHEKGIVHRDLKPANIKVTADGIIKLLDFGLAKSMETGTTASAISPTVSPTLSLAMTQAGMILGTAAYMSPEQARGKPVDKRADIWAFGAVLYELLTGRRPFDGEDISDTMAAVIKQEPSYDGIPPGLQRLLKSCLEKDPRKRLRDIGDAWRLLDETAAPALPAPFVRPRRPIVAWIVAAAGLAAAGALAFVHFGDKTPLPQVTRFTLTFGDLTPGYGAISPDGRQIVMVLNTPGQGGHLALRSLDTIETRDLPATEGGSGPFWSPDNRHIGFGAQGKLKSIDTQGGPPQTLTDIQRFRGATWSSSGVILFSPNGTTLKKIPAGGGTASDVIQGPPAQISPWFLPDGRRFLFVSAGDAPEVRGIYVSSLDGADPLNRQPRRILPDVSRVVFAPTVHGRGAQLDRGTILFVREGTLMGAPFETSGLTVTGDVFPIAEQIASNSAGADRFSASLTGTLIYHVLDRGSRSYTWHDRNGKVLEVTGQRGSYQSVSLSPDGTQFAGDAVAGATSDLWVYDLTRKSKARLTSDPGMDSAPVWSPDGRWIAFDAIRGAVQAIYRKSANGTGPEEVLFQHGSTVHLYDWSRDGKYLLFAAAGGGFRDLYALPLEGERKPIPLATTDFRDDQGRFSPDGRFFAYKSNETGGDQVYVQPFPPRAATERWLVSQGRGTQPRWSRDGKELYYISDGKLMVADVQTAPTFRAGLPRVLFSTQIARRGGAAAVAWDLTPDGKRFLVISEESSSEEQPVNVVLNWQAGLKK
jgi:Tol biopolymer transport system component/predicted Ser/Thr protein kinase